LLILKQVRLVTTPAPPIDIPKRRRGRPRKTPAIQTEDISTDQDTGTYQRRDLRAEE
jgi:hypothetical protein